MKTTQKLATMNANSIEKKQMGKFFGGVGSTNTYTHFCDNTGRCDGPDSMDQPIDMLT